MEIQIEKLVETDRNIEIETPLKVYNPDGMDHKQSLRIKSIEASDEYTRIDFIYRSSEVYDNGGWIQIDKDSYIQPKGSSRKYRLVKAIGIPLAPLKHYFKRQGEYYSYTLVFPALPKNTVSIDIIEKLAPGFFFNFYNIAYSKWMSVPHAADIQRASN